MRRARAIGAAAALLATLACGEERERPLPTGPVEAADLTVELLAPQRDQTVVAGTTLSVRVRGFEPNGRLAGLGFYAVRIGPGRPLLDSALVALNAVSDTTISFDFTVPDSLPTNAQIELLGLATGPAAERALTEGRGVVVLGCSANAVYC